MALPTDSDDILGAEPPPSVMRVPERSAAARGMRTVLCCLLVVFCMVVILPMLPTEQGPGTQQVSSDAAPAPATYDNLLPQDTGFVRGGVPINRRRD